METHQHDATTTPIGANTSASNKNIRNNINNSSSSSSSSKNTNVSSGSAAIIRTSSRSNSSLLMELANHESLAWARHDSMDNMRHRTEFEMMSTLGRGAFGTTFQVRNKVDSNIYALKRVYLGKVPDAKAKRVLQKEVRVLSSLNHENVVRYYGAWVEQGDDHHPASQQSQEEQDDSYSNTIFGRGGGGGDYSSSGTWSPNFGGSSSSDNGVDITTREEAQSEEEEENLVSCHLCQRTYTDWEVSLEHWGLIDAVLESKFLCQSCYLDSLPAHVDPSTIHIREKQIMPFYLFILMEYCESTLQQTLDALPCNDGLVGNTPKTDTIKDQQLWTYFAQCVQGLEHCHSKGIIHRDIKPHNIFVHKGVIKVGDLGLATYNKNSNLLSLKLSRSQDADEDDDDRTNDQDTAKRSPGRPASNGGGSASGKGNSLSSQVGTFLYSAPEVQSRKYDEKCDIFSLGVVMVEMWSQFATAMERALTLSELHNGRIPIEWSVAHPTPSRLAHSMVAIEPNLRPSCSQILGFLLQEGLWEQKNPDVLERLVSDLQICSSNLQKSLEEKEQTIYHLRQLLSENNIVHDHIL